MYHWHELSIGLLLSDFILRTPWLVKYKKGSHLWNLTARLCVGGVLWALFLMSKSFYSPLLPNYYSAESIWYWYKISGLVVMAWVALFIAQVHFTDKKISYFMQSSLRITSWWLVWGLWLLISP